MVAVPGVAVLRSGRSAHALEVLKAHARENSAAYAVEPEFVGDVPLVVETRRAALPRPHPRLRRVNRLRRDAERVGEGEPALGEEAVRRAGVGNRLVDARRGLEALRVSEVDRDLVALEEVVIDARQETIRPVYRRRIHPVVVSQERSDVRVGLRQLLHHPGRDRIQPREGDPVVRERVAYVLEVCEGYVPGGVECGVEPRRVRIVDRDRSARLVDQVRKVAALLEAGRDRREARLADFLPRTLIGEREKGRAAAIVELGDINRSADAEAELVAPQDVAFAAILNNLMRHGVERVVADIFVDAAMP